LKIGANDGQAKPLKPAVFRVTVTRMRSAPDFRRLEHPVTDVSCFQWRSGQGVHQFCPELNLTSTGPRDEDVTERRCAAFNRHRASGAPMGNIGDELIVRHMVDF
jgi:hypothetical protein